MEENNSTEIHRRLAVVTGASSGIGFELAKIFAVEGFDLVVAAEDVGIMAAADKFRECGTRVEALQVDLTTPEGIEKLHSRILLLNRLDAIAMNAGIAVCGEFAKTRLEDELKMIELNVASIVRLTKKVLPQLIKHKGRILYTSAIAADMPGPYHAVYAATKAFVQSFAEAIRIEVKAQGVTVTSLQPGATDTNFYARAHMLDTKAGKSKKDNPADVARDGFDALMAGKDHVVAGSFKNKLQSTMGKLIPDSVAAKIQAKNVKPDEVRH